MRLVNDTVANGPPPSMALTLHPRHGSMPTGCVSYSFMGSAAIGTTFVSNYHDAGQVGGALQSGYHGWVTSMQYTCDARDVHCTVMAG